MFILPDLPYPLDALRPVISAETLRFHHGKHHKAYVDALNGFLEDQGADPGDLESVVREAAGDPKRVKLFNNAAQAWNHGFYWRAMAPGRRGPDGDLAAAIDGAFGGLAGLKATLVKAGVEHFGSGWVWLLAEGDRLSVLATHDAANPLTLDGVVPLTVCDLWEHAYYLDHQNDRRAFLEGWFEALPNWTLAAEQYAAARGRGPAWRYPAPVESSGTALHARR